MSVLEHLEELRSRLLKALGGVGIAFVLCVIFTNQLWHLVALPVESSLRELGLPQELVFTTVMEAFTTVWVELPLLAAVFLACFSSAPGWDRSSGGIGSPNGS